MTVTPIAFSGSKLAAPACTLGEGPTYDPATDTAWWFDILGRKLIEYPLETGAARVHALPVMASVLARVDSGRQVIATETGLHLRDTASGRLELITPIEAGTAATRSNDGRVHPCGALWIGTMGKKAETGAGTIYHVARGKVTVLYPGLTIPNAICFSPDGSVAYFADTGSNRMMRVEIDPATALPRGEAALFLEHRGEGGLDGAVCDAAGTIWNARWGAGSIDAYSPEGRHQASLKVPATRSSCPAFVGKAADRLMVTTAQEGMSAEDLANDPDAGSTFLLDHPVKGRFEPEYRL
ncbi:SMP-30/gluconolactonase/LRE family protein [Hoeflea olei]|uniref:Gluconolaconase n=1 Tax=Hoeflea olei TaxID=1480615 RepID=A0A1C1YUD4_9HYPH|nr:SMP-30/gluconolactonase/LRE family protein [Hoeflea olei]OCW57129.1 gluconolaconase [Hoeflea olei]